MKRTQCMTRKKDISVQLQIFAITLMVIFSGLTVFPAQAADQSKAPTNVLIKNASIFNGKDETLANGMSVLVEGNKIAKISKDISAPKGATVIDAKGRVLMPGLISMHEHIMMGVDPLEVAAGLTDQLQIGALSAERARNFLDWGFTSIRDAGGNAFGLKTSIDRNDIPGPRIYPSGLLISQTGGHGDIRLLADGDKLVDDPHSRGRMEGTLSVTADGVDQVRVAVRNNFFRGASQIKIAAGGGVTSLADPLLATQYTPEEMKAAVEEANRYGSYVMIHAYTDDAITQALDAGVLSVDHATLLSEPVVKRIADEGKYLSLQGALFLRDPEDNTTDSNPLQVAKMKQVHAGAADVFRWANKYNAKVLWGTDTFGPYEVFEKNFSEEWKYRGKFFTPIQQLQQATGNAGELLGKSGLKQPYPNGPLGVIVEGAYADMILVEGNPLENISLMSDPEKNFKVIMKDGKIYKNTLR